MLLWVNLWTGQELILRHFFADSANAPDFEEAWNALSQFGNDHVQGAVISDEDALALLQNQFNTFPAARQAIFFKKTGVRPKLTNERLFFAIFF